jgi:hypothetical protein
MSRCPLLADARFLSLEESPLIKANGVLSFIGGMRLLIGGRSVTLINDSEKDAKDRKTNQIFAKIDKKWYLYALRQRAGFGSYKQ